MRNIYKHKIFFIIRENKMRTILTILSIIFFSELFCDETNKLTAYEPFYCPCFKTKDCRKNLIHHSQILPGYNAPGRFDLPFYLSCTYLLFQPIEKGTIFAFSSDPKTKIFDIKEKFKSGFRISGGFSNRRDDWSFLLNYMQFHSVKHRSITQDAISTWTDINFLGNEIMSKIKARWFLSLNVLDLLLSRPYYCGTHVIFSPNFGLKGGWIKQKFNTINIRQIDSFDFLSKTELESWLIGLTASIKSRFLLDFGFDFFAEATGSLFYQNFKVCFLKNSDISSITDIWKNSVAFLNPNMNISAGLEWGSYFFCNNFHLSLLLGYEGQIYWNQNLMEEIKDYTINNYMQEAGSLFLHGLIANLRMDF